MTDPQIHKGLAGVVVDTTAISSVNPETNSLLYRGYPVHELAAQCSFEEVAFLVWNGDLPSPEQREEFMARERALRLDERTRRALDDIPVSAHPMDILRTAVSQLGGVDSTLRQAGGVLDSDLNFHRALSLLSQLPAIVASVQRRRRGLEPVEPREDLDYSRHFLWLMFGEVPDDVVVDAFKVSLILYAEHSFNASTFTARVIASTLSDIYSAVTGAIGALKGPLHGGANEAVMRAFDEIGTADRAGAWVDSALADNRKVMGFGHRVYKNGDSRVPMMKAAFESLVEHYDRPEMLALYNALELAMNERKNIKPNLDYPSGPSYSLIGFDTDTFTPLFAVARVVGWTAHVFEQYATNSLIRPLSQYIGPAERHLKR